MTKGASIYRREAAISMRAPDDIVGNQDFRNVTFTMAFKNLVRVSSRLSGMSDCILATLAPGLFERFKKFLCRENVRASIRFGAECSEGKCYSRKKAGQKHGFQAK